MNKPWYIGTGEVTISRDKYRSGTGSITIQYKTADTFQGCLLDTWHDYTGSPLNSLGWILIKVIR